MDTIRRSIRERGLVESCRRAIRRVIGTVAARSLDVVLNIRTERFIRLRTLAPGDLRTDDDIGHFKSYQPTPFFGFRTLLRTLDLDHRDYTFVDLGCGLGRVLVNAATYPFAHVIGVELSASMAEQARSNLAHARFLRYRTTARVLCDDARNFEFGADNYVVFMFNPFDATIMRDVLSSMEHALDRHGNRMLVVYYNQNHRTVFDRSERFQQIAAGQMRDWSAPFGYRYAVFAST